jgi:hypothetical protein
MIFSKKKDRPDTFDLCPPLRVICLSATPTRNGRYLRIPAEDPLRFGSDSGHLVADSVRVQVLDTARSSTWRVSRTASRACR